MSFMGNISRYLVSSKVKTFGLSWWKRRLILILIVLIMLKVIVFFYQTCSLNLSIISKITRDEWTNAFVIRSTAVKRGPSWSSVISRSETFIQSTSGSPQTMNEILVILSNRKSREAISLIGFFDSERVNYTAISSEEGLKMPCLFSKKSTIPRFSMIAFDDFAFYTKMNSEQRLIIDMYCKKYGVGILALTSSLYSREEENLENQNLILRPGVNLKQYKLNQDVHFWRVARKEAIFKEDLLLPSDSTVFFFNHKTYRPLVYSVSMEPSSSVESSGSFDNVVVVHDVGLADGIQRIIFGCELGYFLSDIVAMDATTFLTNGSLGFSLERLFRVDVDDLFMDDGDTEDFNAILDSQNRIRAQVPGFTYSFGFVGRFFNNSTGQLKFVEFSDQFSFFNHLYHHERSSLLTARSLNRSISQNFMFAKVLNISTMKDYMATPFLSGTYPIYKTLWDIWIDKGIKYSSTEHYPGSYHWKFLRGFIYRGIKVIPRMGCRLAAASSRWSMVEKDPEFYATEHLKLFLHARVFVFATHIKNFHGDRLIPYMIETTFKYLREYTNLRLRTGNPEDLASKYFRLFPADVMPVWTNQCLVHKLKFIDPDNVTCANFPEFLIVGPEREETLALHNLLKVHPNLSTHKMQGSAEATGLQFFNKEYLRGFQWYVQHFDIPRDPKSTLIFDACADYFEHKETPMRVKALLPSAKIIIVLPEQAKTVWNTIKADVSRFYELNKYLLNIDNVPEPNMTEPEHIEHLKNWLEHFPKHQILIIHSKELEDSQDQTIREIQNFIGVKKIFDYLNLYR